MTDWRTQMVEESWRHTWVLEVNATIELSSLDAEATHFASRLSDAPRAIINLITKHVYCASCGKRYGKGEAEELCDRGMPETDRARKLARQRRSEERQEIEER